MHSWKSEGDALRGRCFRPCPALSVALSCVCKTPCEHRARCALLWVQRSAPGAEGQRLPVCCGKLCLCSWRFSQRNALISYNFTFISVENCLHYFVCASRGSKTQSGRDELASRCPPVQLCCPGRDCGHLQGRDTAAVVLLGPHPAAARVSPALKVFADPWFPERLWHRELHQRVRDFGMKHCS